MQDDTVYDMQMARYAVADLRKEMLEIAAVFKGQLSAQGLVDLGARIRAMSSRFDAVTRMILELQSRACI